MTDEAETMAEVRARANSHDGCPTDIFDRALAAHDTRVRRDAAREALDRLAGESMGAFKSPLSPPDPRSWAEMAGAVEWYRDTHYPEETP